jgi:hypothetical protein
MRKSWHATYPGPVKNYKRNIRAMVIVRTDAPKSPRKGARLSLNKTLRNRFVGRLIVLRLCATIPP